MKRGHSENYEVTFMREAVAGKELAAREVV
jgi:hypothetical protein